MNKFAVKNFVDAEDVLKMNALDHKVFPLEHCVTDELCLEWYNKNPYIYTALFDKERLIGYINFMPITEACYQRHIKGEIKDENIHAVDMEVFKKNGEYRCLFCCVVVDKEYEHTNALALLLTSWFRTMKERIRKDNIKIKSVIADCVNPRIEKFVKNSGFKPVIKNNICNIYEGNLF